VAQLSVMDVGGNLPASSATLVAERAALAPGGYIPAFDGLRALAVAVVVLVHAFGTSHVALVERIARAGWIGVDLFFVLSGFLITRILLDSRAHPHYFRNFYARRVLRIWPAYYALLAVAYVFGAQLDGPAVHVRWPAFVLFVQNLQGSSLFERAAHPSRALGVTWTLAIEEQFYLLWPLFVRRASRPRLVAILLGVLALSPFLRFAFFRAGGLEASFTPLRLDGLAAGALLALLATDARLSRERLRVWSRRLIGLVLGPCVLGVVLLAGLTTGSLADDVWRAVRYSGLALGFAGLVAAALIPGMLPAWLTRAPLRYVGRISYGIYLSHTLVLILFEHVEVPALFGLPHAVLVGLRFLVACAVVVALATLSWFAFERPILAWKTRFAAGR
jgi:peptidoglycan/LPS O-acetylase OafA/YrhL